MQETKVEPVVLTVPEAARYLGIGRSTAFEIIVRDKRIPSMKIGRLRKVRREDLDHFIDERAAESSR